MSIAYHTFKLKATTSVVSTVRQFCDGCNVVLGYVTAPLYRIGQRVVTESSWAMVGFFGTIFMYFPLIAYPYMRKHVGYGERQKKEEDRIRLCLQKGIDPFPYRPHKDFMYGNRIATFSAEHEYPLGASWEQEAVLTFQRKKEELRKQVGGNMDDTVEELKRLHAEYAAYARAHRREPNVPKDLFFPARSDIDAMK